MAVDRFSGLCRFYFIQEASRPKTKRILEWRHESGGSTESSCEALLKEIEDWDEIEEERELNHEELRRRGESLSKLWDLNRKDEVTWRQKSRVLWLKEGEKSTKFFRYMGSIRNRVNYIGGIRRDHGCIVRPEEVKEVIASFFEDLYKGENYPRPRLDGVAFLMLPAETQV